MFSRIAQISVGSVCLALCAAVAPVTTAESEGGWQSLFNGEDFTGWRVPENGPWAVVGGVIDCDPARAPGVGGDIWTEEEFGDFVLYVEWRFTDAPTVENLPVIEPDGSTKVDDAGNAVTERLPNADSGIYLRGQSKAQVNMWNWPVGSGEVYGYRMDQSVPAEVRAGVTPKVRADKPIGEWNTFVISMVDEQLSVILNGQLVINDAQLPGVAERGPIAVQFHGGYSEGSGYRNASSLVQVRNMKIKPLD